MSRPAPAAGPRTVLQITDTHLRGGAGATLLGVDTAASLAAVLDQALAERRPDALVASGDLAHDPEPAAYRRFEQLVRSRFDGPLLCLPGNHDLGAPMAPLLAGPWQLRLGDWEIIGFDTHGDDRVEAVLDARARAALAARLAGSSAAHLLLVCHHPPLPVGCPWLDVHRIPAGGELLESCAAEPRVRALVFGHVHQHVELAFHGLAVLGTPSTCFQFEPGSARFAIDRSAATGMPGYRWLELHPDGRLVSEVRRVDRFIMNIDMSDGS